jgi:hypothetical protein
VGIFAGDIPGGELTERLERRENKVNINHRAGVLKDRFIAVIFMEGKEERNRMARRICTFSSKPEIRCVSAQM